MATQTPRRQDIFSRTQVFALLFLIAALGLGLYLLRHKGADGQTRLVAGDSAAYAFRLDVNSATWQELSLVPGVGPRKAQAIVAWREANGPFRSAQDLSKVAGIGDKTASEIAKYVEFEAQ